MIIRAIVAIAAIMLIASDADKCPIWWLPLILVGLICFLVLVAIWCDLSRMYPDEHCNEGGLNRD